MDFRRAQIFQLLIVFDQKSPLLIFSAYDAYLRNIPGGTFLAKWWSLAWSFAELG